MFCKFCGKEVADGSIQCPYCKGILASDEELGILPEDYEEEAPAPAPAKKEEKKTSKACITGFVFTIIALLFLIIKPSSTGMIELDMAARMGLLSFASTIAFIGMIISIVGTVKASKNELKGKAFGIIGIIACILIMILAGVFTIQTFGSFVEMM